MFANLRAGRTHRSWRVGAPRVCRARGRRREVVSIEPAEGAAARSPTAVAVPHSAAAPQREYNRVNRVAAPPVWRGRHGSPAEQDTPGVALGQAWPARPIAPSPIPPLESVMARRLPRGSPKHDDHREEASLVSPRFQQHLHRHGGRLRPPGPGIHALSEAGALAGAMLAGRAVDQRLRPVQGDSAGRTSARRGRRLRQWPVQLS